MEKVLMQENRQDAGSADALLSVPDKALVSAMEQRGYLAVQGGSSFPARDINKALTAIRGVTRYEDRDTLLGLGYTDEMLCYYGIPPETGVTENPFCGELYFDGWKYSQVCDFLSDFLDSSPFRILWQRLRRQHRRSRPREPPESLIPLLFYRHGQSFRVPEKGS